MPTYYYILKNKYYLYYWTLPGIRHSVFIHGHGFFDLFCEGNFLLVCSNADERLVEALCVPSQTSVERRYTISLCFISRISSFVMQYLVIFLKACK